MFAVVIGLMFTFFGYPFFRFLLPIWAFFAGLMFGFRGIEDLMGPGFVTASFGLIIGFVIGIILAALAYAVYSLAVYLFGLTVGYALGSGLMLAIGFNPGLLTFLVGAAAAVGLAVLFARGNMPRFLIILMTAAAGAMAVMSGIFVLFGQVPTLGPTLEITKYMVWGSWFWLIIWAVVAGFGMAFQYAVTSMTEGDLNEVYDWEKEYTELKAPAKKK
ncbi:DUF4203 domain-containing protein [Patescibacteria group bacterium]